VIPLEFPIRFFHFPWNIAMLWQSAKHKKLAFGIFVDVMRHKFLSSPLVKMADPAFVTGPAREIIGVTKR
jgi:hypothetical protein